MSNKLLISPKHNMRQTLFFLSTSILLCLAFGLAISQYSFADDEPVAHDAAACSPDGIAVGGYDVVAYHTLNDAEKGNADITFKHEGLKYLFASKEHRELFITDPNKYLPHFQGWCAIALARNRLTCPDYKNFKIEDGKLLLFETIAFVNGRNVWNSDPINNLISAEQNFKRFLDQ